MPFPALILIGLGVVSALVGGATLAAYWDDLLIAFKGKKLAILGARGVGKTHLGKFLSSGSLPETYKQTVAPEKTASHRFQLKDLDLKIKSSLDLSGSKEAYAEWKELSDQSDVIFYLLRADRLIEGDEAVEERVRDDIYQIGRWLEARSPRPLFFIIGTHCDLDREFVTLSEDRMGNYTDKFRQLSIICELVARGGGAQLVKVVLGSMKTMHDTEALVYQIFMQVKP